MIHGITEEDEEEDEMEDIDMEEGDQFGPEIGVHSDIETTLDHHRDSRIMPVSPLSPLTPEHEKQDDLGSSTGSGVPLTAEALAKMQEQEEEKEAAKEQASLK